MDSGGEYGTALAVAAQEAQRFLDGLPERPVHARTTRAELHEALGGALPDGPAEPDAVIGELAARADAGVVASQGPRFFGFVIGGAQPAALAADWLVSTWDQNAALYAASPAASVLERIAGDWVAELLGLGPGVSVAFVTGGQMALWTGLATARHHVLAEAGWDVERDGLAGAPPVRVVAGAQRHGTVDRALRFLGFGAAALVEVPADDQGRIRADALAGALAGGHGPAVVVAQAGNVNTGSFDPMEAIAEIAREHGAWVHVDGAFGLWARASARRAHLAAGVEHADSWSVDAHKWLNVPYDCGIALTRHPQAHRAAMGAAGAYLVHDDDVRHDQVNWTPDHSRRARGVPVWAALRTLGRAGVADLVDRLCDRATQFATALGAVPGIEVANEVVLNQVLVRFVAADADAQTRAVIGRIQADGTCWMSGTTWQGRAAMRISVSNWATTAEDVERSVEAVIRCAGLRL